MEDTLFSEAVMNSHFKSEGLLILLNLVELTNNEVEIKLSRMNSPLYVVYGVEVHMI